MCVCVRECLCVCVRLSLFKFKGKTESQTSKLDECVCVWAECGCCCCWIFYCLNCVESPTGDSWHCWPTTSKRHKFFYSVIALFLNDLARLVNLLGKPHFLHGPMIMGVLRLRSESRLSTAVSFQFFCPPPPLFLPRSSNNTPLPFCTSLFVLHYRWMDGSIAPSSPTPSIHCHLLFIISNSCRGM